EAQRQVSAVDDLGEDEGTVAGHGALDEAAGDALVRRRIDGGFDGVEAWEIGHGGGPAAGQRDVCLQDVHGDAGEVADVGIAAGDAVEEGRLAGVGSPEEGDEDALARVLRRRALPCSARCDLRGRARGRLAVAHGSRLSSMAWTSMRAAS